MAGCSHRSCPACRMGNPSVPSATMTALLPKPQPPAARSRGRTKPTDRWWAVTNHSLLLLREPVRHARSGIGPVIVSAELYLVVVVRTYDGRYLALGLRHGPRRLAHRRLLAGDGLSELLPHRAGSLGRRVHFEDELIDTGLVLPLAPCRGQQFSGMVLVRYRRHPRRANGAGRDVDERIGGNAQP